MANATPEQVVDGPARVAAPYGLFSVLDFREPLDRHWEAGGVTWQSFDGSDDLGVIGQVQADHDDITGLPKSFPGGVPVDVAGVFTVYGQHKVTPTVWTQDKTSKRARDLLTGLEERTAERVLAGLIGSLTPNFSDATPFATAYDLVDVVSWLEDFIADNYGSRGVMHLSRGNALIGISRDLVFETRGGGMFTRLGTPVVAGSGYANDVAYATSAMVGYRSAIFENVGRPYDLLDKDTNDLYAIAERTYCIGYEALALGAVTIGDSPA